MHKHLALALTLVCGTAAVAQEAVTDITAGSPNSAYLQDSRGMVVRSAGGMCWRIGFWTPGDAVRGCDGALLPPVANPIAPPIVAAAPAVPAAATPQPAPARRCDFTAVLSGDAAFAFGRAQLRPAARQQLDRDVLSRLNECAKVETVLVTGHADRLGGHQANQKLSEQRANAVAGYLKSKGTVAQIDTLGAGKTQPVKACGDKLPPAQLRACLSPNRRVVIDVRGLAK